MVKIVIFRDDPKVIGMANQYFFGLKLNVIKVKLDARNLIYIFREDIVRLLGLV